MDLLIYFMLMAIFILVTTGFRAVIKVLREIRDKL